MLGHNVSIWLIEGGRIEGILKKLDQAGAFIDVSAGGMGRYERRFIPMHRISEIKDLGEVYR